MAATKVYAARLTGLAVLGPDGESIGRVRDVVVAVRYDRQQPRVHGLVVELPTRRRIFVPMLRVTSIEPGAVALNTGTVSLRQFTQRPGELLAMAQIVDSSVRVEDPDLPDLAGVEVLVVDLGIEQTRTRDWRVSRVAVRGHRRLGRRRSVHVVDWIMVSGLTPYEINKPGQDVTQLLEQFEGLRAADVANQLRELPRKRRIEVAAALADDRLADVLQELPDEARIEVLHSLDPRRAADVLEEMDPDDTADLLGVLPDTEAESLLAMMDPKESEPVRRLLEHSPDTAGGLMTPKPVILTPATTVAEALARVRNPDLSPALASIVFVVRPPTSTPTGRYLGSVHIQQLLREPPAHLVGGILDSDLAALHPEVPLSAVTRYFATYNLVCGPVVDDGNHLVGAVSVDDVLDHLLPDDWRDQEPDHRQVAEEGSAEDHAPRAVGNAIRSGSHDPRFTEGVEKL
ncbi:magnesium transporter MgtE N-terminal domain-containing protein [Nocardia callitridis]|uniref:CBS domain-containing protein n=1 Tax=Nocardia callitridis TaxID=648753 RepID=A0ABP9JR76_9NOCA